MSVKDIEKLLKSVKYPNFEKDIVEFGFIKGIKVDGNNVEVTLSIPSADASVKEQLKSSILKVLKDYKTEVIVEQPQTSNEKVQFKNLVPTVKEVIMISSGKGGVGKSTVAVNLALAYQKLGKKVGLLDCDITGPNIPRMMGVNDSEPLMNNNKVEPVEAYGIKIMSMGFVAKAGEAVIWRGSMITRAVIQFLRDINWGELDLLVVDMPPGTGDAQLTLVQNIPVTKGVVVSTPQTVSIDDSLRSIDMFKKVNIEVAGIVENMSGFTTPEGVNYDIFGSGTLEIVAKKADTKVLAKVPIIVDIREGSDKGVPAFISNKDVENIYLQLARSII